MSCPGIAEEELDQDEVREIENAFYADLTQDEARSAFSFEMILAAAVRIDSEKR